MGNNTIPEFRVVNNYAKETPLPNFEGDFIKEAYYAEGGFKDMSYLLPHNQEEVCYYNTRKKRSHFRNYLQSIIDASYRPVFSGEIYREYNGSSATHKGFEDDCDMQGTSLTTFLERVYLQACFDGVSYIVVDNLDVDNLTEAEVRGQRKYPYVYQLFQKEKKDHTLWPDGSLADITFLTANVIEKEGKEYPVYRYYTQRGVKEYIEKENNEIEVIKEVERNFKYFPVIPVIDNKKGVIDSGSKWYSVAWSNYQLFQVDSEIRYFIYKSGAAPLSLPVESGQESVRVGHNDALTYPPESTNKPEFITPPSTMLVEMMNYADKQRQELFRLAGQEGVTGVQSKESGISKEWDFVAQADRLKTVSNTVESAEYEIWKRFNYFRGLKTEVNLSYKKTFTDVSQNNKVELIFKALDRNLGETVEKELVKQLIENLMPSKSPSQKEMLFQAIEKEYMAEMPPNDRPVFGETNL